MSEMRIDFECGKLDGPRAHLIMDFHKNEYVGSLLKLSDACIMSLESTLIHEILHEVILMIEGEQATILFDSLDKHLYQHNKQIWRILRCI